MIVVCPGEVWVGRDGEVEIGHRPRPLAFGEPGVAAVEIGGRRGRTRRLGLSRGPEAREQGHRDQEGGENLKATSAAHLLHLSFS